MKQIVVFGAILALVVGGYFVVKNRVVEAPLENTQDEVVVGSVLEVDRSGAALDGPILLTLETEEGEQETIAVPSMGIQLCAAYENIADPYTTGAGDRVEVRGARDEEGRIVPCEREDDYLRVMGIAMDETFGFQFWYPKGPDGYVTLEDTYSTDPDFVTGLTLMNKAEYDELMASDDAREGPPAMGLRVYTNPQNLHAPVWAMRHPLESNVELKLGESEEAVVGGANAEHYLVDGLYPIDTYVIASGDHIYVLTGAYREAGDKIYEDFQKLVESFEFTPPAGFDSGEGSSQGGAAVKLDPRVACESALIYMSFASGTEADAFVEACVAGEHPEVIDRYIREQGLDGAVI